MSGQEVVAVRTLELANGAVGQICRSKALEALLFDRASVGAEFRRSVRAAVADLISPHAHSLGDAEETTAELILLSKGLLYDISNLLAFNHDITVGTNLMATRRAAVTSEAARIEIPYRRLDCDASRLLIGDTVASGSTICASIDSYLQVFPLRAVTVFTLAGSLVGANRIVRHCHQLGVQVDIVFGLAAFGLADNGFDLSFLHPDTIADPDLIRRAAKIYRELPVSAVGWDFGSQALSPMKYQNLLWLEAESWDLHDHPQFAGAVPPDDFRTVAHESAAYSESLPHLPSEEPRDVVG